jgi:D-alanyl-D-alanine dipeptidase
MARIFGLIIALGVLLVGGIAVWRSLHSSPAGPTAPERVAVDLPPSGESGAHVVLVQTDGPECRGSVSFQDAARRNAESASGLEWAPYGRQEVGWMIYAPMIAHEIGAGCSPASPVFAEALAGWQQAHGQKPTGVLTPEQFEVMKIDWYRRMYHVPGANRETCTVPGPQADAATAAPDESYGGKTIQLDPNVLAAYRRMVQAARAEVPDLKAQPQMLQIFSGFRAPDADAMACAQRGGCVGPVKSKCSNHRTGRALDIVMGAAPGQRVDSSADSNRLFMSQTGAYRWMVANADRFGFVNYPFEPWPWEWTGTVVGTEASR